MLLCFETLQENKMGMMFPGVVFLAVGYSAIWCPTVPYLHYTRTEFNQSFWPVHITSARLKAWCTECSLVMSHAREHTTHMLTFTWTWGEVLGSGTVSQVPAGYLGQERRATWNGASGMAAGSRRSCRPTASWRTRPCTPRPEHMWGGHFSLLLDYKLLTSWQSLYCVMWF